MCKAGMPNSLPILSILLTILKNAQYKKALIIKKVTIINLLCDLLFKIDVMATKGKLKVPIEIGSCPYLGDRLKLFDLVIRVIPYFFNRDHTTKWSLGTVWDIHTSKKLSVLEKELEIKRIKKFLVQTKTRLRISLIDPMEVDDLNW